MQRAATAATAPSSLTAAEIADIVDGEIVGDRSRRIRNVQLIEEADQDDLAFVGSAKNAGRIRKSLARVIIVPPDVVPLVAEIADRTFLVVAEPEAAFLLVASLLFPPRSRPRIGTSPHAVIDATATLGSNCNIHPFAVIGRDVVLGHNCDIHSGVVIGDGCVIGDHVTIHANTVLYADTLIGNQVTIHAGCVIGADGFGYRLVDGRHQRLPHFGVVRICDDVEIGACTTIDRAKIGETSIGTGTRIDNQVMIGHNCRVGRHNLLVSQVGFAGSVTTGDYVVCAGQAGIADHVHLGDGAIIGAKAGVHRDLPGGQSYLGAPAAPVADTTRQLMALRRLPDLRDTVKRIDKELTQLRRQLETVAQVSPADTPLRAAS